SRLIAAVPSATALAGERLPMPVSSTIIETPPDDEALQKRIYRADLLLQLTRSCASFNTLTEVLEHVLNVSMKEVGAERGTLFLNDPETGELYSRITGGGPVREIRILNDTGIA